jgi:hypothetical protein
MRRAGRTESQPGTGHGQDRQRDPVELPPARAFLAAASLSGVLELVLQRAGAAVIGNPSILRSELAVAS